MVEVDSRDPEWNRYEAQIMKPKIYIYVHVHIQYDQTWKEWIRRVEELRHQHWQEGSDSRRNPSRRRPCICVFVFPFVYAFSFVFVFVHLEIRILNSMGRPDVHLFCVVMDEILISNIYYYHHNMTYLVNQYFKYSMSNSYDLVYCQWELPIFPR